MEIVIGAGEWPFVFKKGAWARGGERGCISHFFLCVRKSRGGQVDKIEDVAEEEDRGGRGGGGETGLRDGGDFRKFGKCES